MTERKKLKKMLSKLKFHRSKLPLLIDCSKVYGDNFYTEDDLLDVNKQIDEVERRIAAIDTEAELNGG